MPAKPEVRASRERLLRDPRVSRWYKNRGRQSTADTYVANLELFLRRTELSLEEMIALARAQRSGNGDEGRFADHVLKWVATERKAGRPDAYLATVWASVRGFLKSVEAAPSWVPNLKVRAASTILDEVVPTPEQLRGVLDRNPTPRNRASILLLATSGMRPGVIASRATIDGLRLGSLPDLDLKKLEFRRLPFKIDVPANLSKSGSAYFTFATAECAEALIAYLRTRAARGERLSAASAVIAPAPKTSVVHLREAADGTAFLSEKGFAHEIRLALRKAQPAGVRWRPYVLRSYASSQMYLGENAGLITRDTREFLLGHSADIGRRYNIAKGRVRADMEDEIRESYARAADRFLRVTTTPDGGVDYRPILRVLLAGSGYTKSQIDAEGELTEERVIEMIRAKRRMSAEVPAPKPGDNARTVLVSELDSFLSKGWRPIAPAGQDRFVVGAPN